MPLIEIKNRWTGSVIFSVEADSIKLAVKLAIESKVSLSEADLSKADLSKANLSKADLSKANLSKANLSKADLSKADLSEADLSEANLSKADLSEANLSKADLSEANLSEANLSKADLSWADLQPIRDDVWAILSASPREVPALREALANGKVDGSTYGNNGCGCLVGTLAIARHCSAESIPGLVPNSSRPAERFFLAIKLGDTPDTNGASRIALEWVDTWLANMRAAFAGAS